MNAGLKPASSGPGTAVERRPQRRWWLLAFVLLLLFVSLGWGAHLLISTDELPARADAAIVLQGSIEGELARIRGAMDLLRQGRIPRVVASVPKESYWGEAVSPAARNYLVKNYGADLAANVVFCETGPGTDSTQREAAALIPCIREHGWQNIVIVTSDYHTRRAGIIWRGALHRTPSVRVSIYGVPDPEFNASRWWQNRTSAKTWYFETTKLFWAVLFG